MGQQGRLGIGPVVPRLPRRLGAARRVVDTVLPATTMSRRRRRGAGQRRRGPGQAGDRTAMLPGGTVSPLIAAVNVSDRLRPLTGVLILCACELKYLTRPDSDPVQNSVPELDMNPIKFMS